MQYARWLQLYSESRKMMQEKNPTDDISDYINQVIYSFNRLWAENTVSYSGRQLSFVFLHHGIWYAEGKGFHYTLDTQLQNHTPPPWNSKSYNVIVVQNIPFSDF